MLHVIFFLYYLSSMRSPSFTSTDRCPVAAQSAHHTFPVGPTRSTPSTASPVLVHLAAALSPIYAPPPTPQPNPCCQLRPICPTLPPFPCLATVVWNQFESANLWTDFHKDRFTHFLTHCLWSNLNGPNPNGIWPIFARVGKLTSHLNINVMNCKSSYTPDTWIPFSRFLIPSAARKVQFASRTG